MKQSEIKTYRLLLRRFLLEDAEQVEYLAGNYNVSKTTLNIPYPYSIEMVEEWIKVHTKIDTDGVDDVFAVINVKTNELIGAVGLLEINNKHAQIGYWIGEPFWGKGYCTEATKALIHYAFTDLNLTKLLAEHIDSNSASGRIMLKSGMHHVKSVTKENRFGDLVAIETYEIKAHDS